MKRKIPNQTQKYNRAEVCEMELYYVGELLKNLKWIMEINPNEHAKLGELKYFTGTRITKFQKVFDELNYEQEIVAKRMEKRELERAKKYQKYESYIRHSGELNQIKF